MWLILVSLRIIVAHTIAPWMIKKASTESGREERFLLQFVSATSLSILCSLILGLSLNWLFLLTIGVGFINGFAAYCQWRAVEISLSKTSLFTWGDDAICMILAYFFLDEGLILSTSMKFGILFSFVAVALFSYSDYHKKDEKKLLMKKTVILIPSRCMDG